jgi:thiol-disulfide isomerase/thioredoxin
LQKEGNWIPDTVNLSQAPLKTKIAYAYGKDEEGNFKIAVDVNNNYDLSDDKPFFPIDRNSFSNSSNKDSLAQAHSINVSFEVFAHNKIVSMSVPLFIYSSGGGSMFMNNFSQYRTIRYKGEEIAVFSSDFTDLSYNDIGVALISDLKVGEKVKKENIYRKNEYIEIKDEVYKILGVNINKNTLVLEKNDLPKSKLFTTQVGYKPYPFQGEDFTTKAAISLEDYKGKYVFLDFWAEWCAPCIAEFPYLKELYSKTDRTKFEIIGIAGQSTPDGIQRLIEQHELTWSQILSDDIIKMYGVTNFPTTILLDTEGFVVAKNLKGEKLEEKILSLIKE